MGNLTGKVAVVTGGNSGIGYATAQRFVNEGAQVIITGRSEEKVEQASKELGVQGFVADVSDLSALNRLVEQVQVAVNKVDVLFVNAGVFFPTPVGQISEELFDTQMNINFKGAVFTVEKFLPILNEGASIINLSSVNAYTGMPNTAVYAASKAAMNSFTRTAATELAPRKIWVNVVNPGPVATPIFSKTGLSEEQLNSFAQSIQEKVLLNRFGKPEELASLITFLSSEKASFINGSTIPVDGGSVKSLL